MVLVNEEREYLFPKKRSSSFCKAFCCCLCICCCVILLLLLLIISGSLLWYKHEVFNTADPDNGRTTSGNITIVNLNFYSNTSFYSSSQGIYHCTNEGKPGIIFDNSLFNKVSLPIGSAVVIPELAVAASISSQIQTSNDISAYLISNSSVFEMVETIQLNSTLFETVETTFLNMPVPPEPVTSYISLDNIPTYFLPNPGFLSNNFLLESSVINELGITETSLLYKTTHSNYLETVTQIKKSDSTTVLYTTIDSYIYSGTPVKNISFSSLELSGCSSASNEDGIFIFSNPDDVETVKHNDVIVGRPSSGFLCQVIYISPTQTPGFSQIECLPRGEELMFYSYSEDPSSSIGFSNDQNLFALTTTEDKLRCFTFDVKDYLPGMNSATLWSCNSWDFHPTASWEKTSSGSNELQVLLKGDSTFSINFHFTWDSGISLTPIEIPLYKFPKIRFWVPDSPVFGYISGKTWVTISASASDYQGYLEGGYVLDLELTAGFTYEYPYHLHGIFDASSIHGGQTEESIPHSYAFGCGINFSVTFHYEFEIFVDGVTLTLDAKPAFEFSKEIGENCNCSLPMLGNAEVGLDGIGYSLSTFFVVPIKGEIPYTTKMKTLFSGCTNTYGTSGLCFPEQPNTCDNPESCVDEGLVNCKCLSSTDSHNYYVAGDFTCANVTLCSENSLCTDIFGSNVVCIDSCCGAPICMSKCFYVCNDGVMEWVF